MEPNNQSNPWGDYSQGGVYKVGGQDIAEQSKEIADSWSISPEQSEAIKELSVQLAYDMAPVTGEARAIMYADKAAQRAAAAFKNGEYWEGAGHTAEQYTEMLGAIPIGGMALGAIADVSRFGKGAYRVLSSPQIPMKTFKKITDPELNIREMSLPDAIDMAKTERHIIPDTSKGADGHFQGSPKDINTRMELQQMRDHFDYLVNDGIAGWDWYKRAQRGFTKLKPGPANKQERLRLAGESAVLSAQADPRPNFGWVIEAENAFARGGKALKNLMVRTPEQTDKIIKARTGVLPAGEYYEEALGPKTGVYNKNISSDIDDPATGTNDIWHGRAFGYKMDDGSEIDRGFTPQEHRFLDHETVLAVDRANARKLAGRTDWTAAEIQAMAWVSAKGRGLFAKNPEKYGNDLQEAMREAVKTYPDSFPYFTVQGTHESIPSPDAIDHLPSLQDASWDQKMEYNDAASFIDPNTNQDIAYDAAGVLQDTPGKGVGEWQGKNNPVNNTRFLASLTDSERGKIVAPASADLATTITAIKQYMDVQAGGAWSKAFPLGTTGTKKSSSGSYSIELDRPLTVPEMQKLSKVARKNGLDVIDTGQGVNLANFNSTKGDMLAKSLGADNSVWLDMVSSPLGKNINKVFTNNKAGALTEIKFKLKKDPSKKEKAFFSDLRNGRAVHSWKDDKGVIQSVTDESKYQVRVKDRYVTIKQIKSPGDEMEKLLDKGGLEKDINNIFPNHQGRLSRVEGDLTEMDFSVEGGGEATKVLYQKYKENPSIFKNIDDDGRVLEQAGKMADRNEAWGKELSDPVRKDIQLALRTIQHNGFTGLFEAMKRGAILPAIAGPLLMYGLRQEPGQQEGLLSPGT